MRDFTSAEYNPNMYAAIQPSILIIRRAVSFGLKPSQLTRLLGNEATSFADTKGLKENLLAEDSEPAAG